MPFLLLLGQGGHKQLWPEFELGLLISHSVVLTTAPTLYSNLRNILKIENILSSFDIN